MRSKEIEEAIKRLDVLCDFGLSTILQKEQIQDIDTVLSYISELEEKVEKYNKQLDLDYVDNNFVSKDAIRDKMKELEDMSISQDIYFDDVMKIFKELLGDENE